MRLNKTQYLIFITTVTTVVIFLFIVYSGLLSPRRSGGANLILGFVVPAALAAMGAIVSVSDSNRVMVSTLASTLARSVLSSVSYFRRHSIKIAVIVAFGVVALVAHSSLRKYSRELVKMRPDELLVVDVVRAYDGKGYAEVVVRNPKGLKVEHAWIVLEARNVDGTIEQRDVGYSLRRYFNDPETYGTVYYMNMENRLPTLERVYM
ncbi:MAG: hypothetical protein IPH49_04050 [Ignavibacteria bacterium]|nr:hypothetical protein [Ignavibacteria bacterium]